MADEVLLSQLVADCSGSMDSTQSRLNFESKEDVDSLHLKQMSGNKILLSMSNFLRELSVNFMKLFRKSRKSRN